MSGVDSINTCMIKDLFRPLLTYSRKFKDEHIPNNTNITNA